MAKRKYRVREGFRYGAHDQFTAGQIVELEEEEAKHDLDKLELAEVVQNVPGEAGVDSEPGQPPRDEDSPSEPGKAPGGGEGDGNPRTIGTGSVTPKTRRKSGD